MTTPTHLLALVEFLKQAAIVAKSVLADGKVGISDFVTLAKLWTPAKTALEALSGVTTDWQSLDSDGVAKLVAAGVEALTLWAQVLSSGALKLA